MILRKYRLVMGGILFLAVASGIFVAAPSVYGLVSGKSAYVGYFDGNYETSGHYVFQEGMYTNSINSFVSTIKSRLNDSGDRQHQRGAAFIILTMLGDSGSHSVSEAQNKFDEWEGLVRAYNSAGLIDFSKTISYSQNSFYQGSSRDVASYYDGGTYSSIVFKDPGNTNRIAYAIKRLCGNPVGDIGPLPKLGWSLSVTSYIGIKGKLSYTTGTINVEVGDVVQIKHTVKNDGGGEARFDRWQMMSAAGGSSYTDGPHLAATLSGGDSADYPGVGTRDHTITASQLNKKYCARYAVDPRSSTNGSELDSTPVCYVVVESGGTSSTCPVQGTTLASVSFNGGSNDGEVTYRRGSTTYSSPPSGYPKDGDSTTRRAVSSYTADSSVLSGRSSYRLPAVPGVSNSLSTVGSSTVDFSNAISVYPYDTNTASVMYADYYYSYTKTWNVDSDGNGSWTAESQSGPSLSQLYYGSASLGECNYRTFDIQPQGGSASFDNPEYPSSASISDPIDATFGFDGPTPHNLRQASRVSGISLSPSKLIVRHADGAPDSAYPYPTATTSNFPSYYAANSTTDNSSTSTATATYRATIPRLRYGDQICYELTANPGSGTMKADGTIVTRSGTNSDPVVTCSGHLAARPYFRVFGGDVAVGGGVQRTNGIGVSSTCTASSGAGISAWNRNASGLYAGSGSQYAVQALGAIRGFSSSLYNRSSNPATGAPAGLSFANTTNPPFGGNFGGIPGCKDYVNNLPATTHKYASSMEITGLNLSAGSHETYYVTGNVFISGDVVYTNRGSWIQPEDIPTFKLVVVGGNIYISPEVHQLDGLYVAERDGSGNGGTIVTCAYSTGAVADDSLFDDCAESLTINGSFVANQVKLLRTRGQNGTNYQSDRNETPANSHAAEIFNYTPEEWIAGPPNTYNGTYDSFTSLAPIL